MAQKKSYSRYFIILQEDEKGYSLSSDKVASGYAKLELKNDKCKISYYVQNLKKEIKPYYMILICNKKDVKKVIKIGEMNIDDYGRADVCYEYPINNVADSNISMDKVTGAAIVKLDEGNITSVMSGFASTEIPDWKSFQVVENKTRSSDEEKIVVEEKSIFDKYEESIVITKKEERNEVTGSIDNADIQDDLEQIRKEVIQEETIEESQVSNEQNKEIVESVSEQRNDETTGSIEEKLSLENKEDSNRDSIENTEKEENKLIESNVSEEEQYRNEEKDNEDSSVSTATRFFKSLVMDFEQLPNMCSEIKRCDWYKVPVRSEQDIDDKLICDKYKVIYDPMIRYSEYTEEYGHYLIGYKYDKDGEVKYLIYGLPGRKDVREQPYEGRSGFVTWIPTDERELNGYWLMFYDYKTSTIMIPVKR